MENIDIDEAVNELCTIQDMIRWSVSCFNSSQIYYGHGTDNPWDEALHLVLPTIQMPMDIPQEMLLARLTKSERKSIAELVVKRITERIPVAYLTNRAWFSGLEFYVDERVLIPRSPIGELIEKQFQAILPTEPQYILDLCTGSGCIAIACAYAFPQAEVDAVDISTDVLVVAEYNIEQHQKVNQVTPICSDLFNDLLSMPYDLIVTNPPYVDAEDLSDMPDEYHQEPQLGLAAGRDGLDLVRKILCQAADYLSEQGVLVCEVGNSMTHLIEQYPEVPFNWLEFDYGGEGVFTLTRQQLIACQHLFRE